MMVRLRFEYPNYTEKQEQYDEGILHLDITKKGNSLYFLQVAIAFVLIYAELRFRRPNFS